MEALTSAPSCVCLRSCAPVSPSVWGRTGTWSCNLRGASRDRSRRSQLEDRRETGGQKKHTRNHSAVVKGTRGPRAGPGFIPAPFTPGCACWDVSPCKEELTRQPIFNSSALSSVVPQFSEPLARIGPLGKNLAPADNPTSKRRCPDCCKTEVTDTARSGGRRSSRPSVASRYLEGCGQPAWPRPRLCTGAGRGTGLS